MYHNQYRILFLNERYVLEVRKTTSHPTIGAITIWKTIGERGHFASIEAAKEYAKTHFEALHKPEPVVAEFKIGE